MTLSLGACGSFQGLGISWVGRFLNVEKDRNAGSAVSLFFDCEKVSGMGGDDWEGVRVRVGCRDGYS